MRNEGFPELRGCASLLEQSAQEASILALHPKIRTWLFILLKCMMIFQVGPSQADAVASDTLLCQLTWGSNHLGPRFATLQYRYREEQ